MIAIQYFFCPCFGSKRPLLVLCNLLNHAFSPTTFKWREKNHDCNVKARFAFVKLNIEVNVWRANMISYAVFLMCLRHEAPKWNVFPGKLEWGFALVISFSKTNPLGYKVNKVEFCTKRFLALVKMSLLAVGFDCFILSEKSHQTHSVSRFFQVFCQLYHLFIRERFSFVAVLQMQIINIMLKIKTRRLFEDFDEKAGGKFSPSRKKQSSYWNTS